MSSQKSVDDLFDQMTNGGSEPKVAEAASSVETPAESPAAAEATSTSTEASASTEASPAAESDANTEVASEGDSAAKKKDLKEVPSGVWGSRKDPRFVLVSEALEDRLYQMQKRLRINEDLMLTYLFREEIHEAYYKLWRQDANSLFRSVISAKHRLAVERKKEKA